MSWKDIRIKEINAMGYMCDDSHPFFDEVQAIYESTAETYKEFKVAFCIADLESRGMIDG